MVMIVVGPLGSCVCMDKRILRLRLWPIRQKKHVRLLLQPSLLCHSSQEARHNNTNAGTRATMEVDIEKGRFSVPHNCLNWVYRCLTSPMQYRAIHTINYTARQKGGVVQARRWIL